MRKRWFVFCLACFCCATVAAEDGSGNLILNPGFEESGFPPPHWARNSTAQNWPDFGTYDTVIKHGGTQSLKLVRKPDEQHTYWHQQDIRVEPETDYVFGGWIKVENVEGTMGAFIHIFGFPEGTNNHADRIFWTNARTAKGTQDWQEYKAIFRTPPSADHVTLFLQHSRCSGTCWYDDIYLRRDMFLTQPVFSADNGIIKLRFEEPGPYYLAVFRDGRFAGRLGGAIAQFEKEGVGYKKSGVGSAYATGVKGIEVKTREPAECVVDVTLERTVSGETERMFEAVYRVTLHADRPWFESRLVSVKNTDKVDYELRGYYHLLQPKIRGVLPRCYDRIGGWFGKSPSLGAVNRDPDDFTLGFRKIENSVYGEITRRLIAKMKPGFAWNGAEPGVIIFAAPTEEEKDYYRDAIGILSDLQWKDAGPPKGKITYAEKKPESTGKP